MGFLFFWLISIAGMVAGGAIVATSRSGEGQILGIVLLIAACLLAKWNMREE
jgi:hypothetical protein